MAGKLLDLGYLLTNEPQLVYSKRGLGNDSSEFTTSLGLVKNQNTVEYYCAE